MNEARRFIRYLFPGMIFIVLLTLYLYISAGKEFTNAVGEAIRGGNHGAGILEAGMFIIFISGAGYLFATIYHAIGHLIPPFGLPNHARFLEDAVVRGWVRVLRRRSEHDDAGQVSENEISTFNRFEAWSITGSYFHVRIHQPEFRDAHVRIESLNDIVHGLGASFVGSVVALPVWSLLHREVACGWPCATVVVKVIGVGALISALLLINYFRTGRQGQNLLDGISAEFMAKESGKRGGPIPLYFPGRNTE